MALLIVMVSLAMISAIVTDLLIDQNSGYQVALRQRDAFKAEALAKSGLNLGQVFLIIQNKIQVHFTQFAAMGMPLPQYTVWEMLSIDSNLFKNLASGDLATTLGLDVSEALKKRQEDEKNKPKPKALSTDFVAPKGGFGAFEGNFSVSISDEESRISLRKWVDATEAKDRLLTKKLLSNLVLPVRYDALFKKITRQEIIANIFDYMDVDEVRINPNAIGDDWGTPFGGSERELYVQTKIYPRNSYLDSLEELKLVHGVTDGHMQAFAKALTIYGQGKKINILSAKEAVIEPLIRYCAKSEFDPSIQNQKWVDAAVKKWAGYKSTGQGPVSVKGFSAFLKNLPLAISEKECEDAIGVESTNFTLKSQATVGLVQKTFIWAVRNDKSGQDGYYFRGL